MAEAELTEEQRAAAARQLAEIDQALITIASNEPDESWHDWLVDVPEFHGKGVKIERFAVDEHTALVDQLRAVLNPQRSDRSLQAGTFTRLEVDGVTWMTDTPAEIYDLLDVDQAMHDLRGGSMLIAGLGLGVVLNRAIRTHRMHRIDVVEREQRVLDAVGGHYEDLAKEHNVNLRLHCLDIHDFRALRGSRWDVGFFDIWPSIDMNDRPEVARLRRRFRDRVAWFGAWAQDERNAQAKRIREKRGWY